MKLMKYDCKERNFNLLECVKKLENSDKTLISLIYAVRPSHWSFSLNPFQANIPNYGKTASFIQHIHGKNFQDYLEWENAFIFGIILNILVGFSRAKNSLENNISYFSINKTQRRPDKDQ